MAEIQAAAPLDWEQQWRLNVALWSIHKAHIWDASSLTYTCSLRAVHWCHVEIIQYTQPGAECKDLYGSNVTICFDRSKPYCCPPAGINSTAMNDENGVVLSRLHEHHPSAKLKAAPFAVCLCCPSQTKPQAPLAELHWCWRNSTCPPHRKWPTLS